MPTRFMVKCSKIPKSYGFLCLYYGSGFIVFANKKKKVSSLSFLYKRRSDRQTDPRFSREIAGGGSGVQFKELSQGVALASSVGGDAGADLCICNS